MDATGRKDTRGLADWPGQGVTNLNPFTRRSKDFTVVIELVNDQNAVIGRQTLRSGGSWEFNLNQSSPTIRSTIIVSEGNRPTINISEYYL